MMLSRTASAAARRLISSRRPVAATSSAAARSAAAVSSCGHQRRVLNVAARPSDLIGNTPLIDLNKILAAHGVDGEASGFGFFMHRAL